MTTNSVIFILLSIIIAAAISYYKYFYKIKNSARLRLFLFFLRFLSLLGLFILLINPIIQKKSFEIKKVSLPILVDNSESIAEILKGNNAIEKFNQYKSILSDKALNEKYAIDFYTFDEFLNSNKEVNFKGKQTNIDIAAKNLRQLYRNQKIPVVIFTDGNQTSGNDYLYSFENTMKLFPVVVGDTATVFDLKINQVNSNKYAFLKNRFPVEFFLQYNGKNGLKTKFLIENNGKVIHKQDVVFLPNEKIKTIEVLLDADKIGIQKFKAVLQSNLEEKNKINNSKWFVVEVIDQRKNIALISSIHHPDLGIIKRSIETNEQRKVTLYKPNELTSLDKIDLLIYYQPNSTFKPIFDKNNSAQLNSFLITGTQTDYNFLNQIQGNFLFKMSSQSEVYNPFLNSAFTVFSQEDIKFNQFPPLDNTFGSILPKTEIFTLLNATVRGINTGNPMLCFSEQNNQRQAYLFGENIWKWRMESYVQEENFEKFDRFMDKTVQFISSNSSKDALKVDYKKLYNYGETIEINAQFFNKNYELDANAKLSIRLFHNETKKVKEYIFSKSNLFYKVLFENLDVGNYQFTVKEELSKKSINGQFEVLNFDFEKQFVSSDYHRLKELAKQSSGKTFYLDNVSSLIDELKKDTEYLPIQKEIITKKPIIDWKWLLIIICSLLSVEWFVRKYNGML